MRDSCLNKKRLSSKDDFKENFKDNLENKYTSNYAGKNSLAKTPDNKLELKFSDKPDVFDKLKFYRYTPRHSSSNENRKQIINNSKEHNRTSKYLNDSSNEYGNLKKMNFLNTLSTKNVYNKQKNNYSALNNIVKTEKLNTN